MKFLDQTPDPEYRKAQAEPNNRYFTVPVRCFLRSCRVFFAFTMGMVVDRQALNNTDTSNERSFINNRMEPMEQEHCLKAFV